MIRFECANLKGLLECASLVIQDSKVSAIITETDVEKNLLLQVITGLTGLDSGRVFVLGKELSAASRSGINDIRRRTGVVLKNGGLVSNLKVWENILLPLTYHTAISHEAAEKTMMSILERIGYDDDPNKLPGLLPPYKKRLAGIARAMLMEPDLIIYDSVLDGLSPDIRVGVLDAVNLFHGKKKGRASLFLASSESSINIVKTDSVYILSKGIFHERN